MEVTLNNRVYNMPDYLVREMYEAIYQSIYGDETGETLQMCKEYSEKGKQEKGGRRTA